MGVGMRSSVCGLGSNTGTGVWRCIKCGVQKHRSRNALFVFTVVLAFVAVCAFTSVKLPAFANQQDAQLDGVQTSSSEQASSGSNINLSNAPETTTTGIGWTYDLETGVYTVNGYATPSAGLTIRGISTNKRIVVAETARVTIILDGVNITSSSASPVTLGSGSNVVLKLSGANTLTSASSFAGVNVPGGSDLVITSELGDGNVSGSLTVNGGLSGASGIGGNSKESSGSITISGGTITAVGGLGGAGIGSGLGTAGTTDTGNITISGGNITATGGAFAAAIGGGQKRSSGTILINGGTVNATAGIDGSGLGGGANGEGGSITINSGLVNAYAPFGSSGVCAIGIGAFGSSPNINITGGTVVAVSIPTKGSSIGGGNTAYGTLTISGGTIIASSDVPVGSSYNPSVVHPAPTIPAGSHPTIISTAVNGIVEGNEPDGILVGNNVNIDVSTSPVTISIKTDLIISSDAVFTIPVGVKVEIPSGKTLTIADGGTLDIAGALDIASGGKVTVADEATVVVEPGADSWLPPHSPIEVVSYRDETDTSHNPAWWEFNSESGTLTIHLENVYKSTGKTSVKVVGDACGGPGMEGATSDCRLKIQDVVFTNVEDHITSLTIGDFAFTQLSINAGAAGALLASVLFPEGLTNLAIGDYAFAQGAYRRTSLKTITFPETLTSLTIGDWAFGQSAISGGPAFKYAFLPTDHLPSITIVASTAFPYGKPIYWLGESGTPFGKLPEGDGGTSPVLTQLYLAELTASPENTNIIVAKNATLTFTDVRAVYGGGEDQPRFLSTGSILLAPTTSDKTDYTKYKISSTVGGETDENATFGDNSITFLTSGRRTVTLSVPGFGNSTTKTYTVIAAKRIMASIDYENEKLVPEDTTDADSQETLQSADAVYAIGANPTCESDTLTGDALQTTGSLTQFIGNSESVVNLVRCDQDSLTLAIFTLPARPTAPTQGEDTFKVDGNTDELFTDQAQTLTIKRGYEYYKLSDDSATSLSQPCSDEITGVYKPVVSISTTFTGVDNIGAYCIRKAAVQPTSGALDSGLFHSSPIAAALAGGGNMRSGSSGSTSTIPTALTGVNAGVLGLVVLLMLLFGAGLRGRIRNI
ncbi:MAG: carbohydrate-binding domain-containing protein [Candidatus Ancillula sp.]|nr:carbohydrate-binding domain-containing protein [Candidatus Ancillula sp.]